MANQTYPKQRPLTIAETAAKLREKPHTLICNEDDALVFLENLLKYGFYFVPSKEGHWEIFDMQDKTVKAELRTDSHCEKGQNYVIDNSVLEFPRPSLELNFPSQDESIIWSSFMRYGPIGGNIW
jgi:hypothetical protein